MVCLLGLFERRPLGDLFPLSVQRETRGDRLQGLAVPEMARSALLPCWDCSPLLPWLKCYCGSDTEFEPSGGTG